MSIFQPDDTLPYVLNELKNLLPEDKNHVFVSYYTLDGKFKMTTAHRVGDNWVFGATLKHDALVGKVDKTKFEGGFFVSGSW